MMGSITTLHAVRDERRPRVTAMVCMACGAASNASCDCHAPYVPPGKRVEAVLASNIHRTNTVIAQQVGVDEATVRRARKRMVKAGVLPLKKASSAHAELEPRRLGQNGRLYAATHRYPRSTKAAQDAKAAKLFKRRKQKGRVKPPVTDKDHLIAFTRELSNFVGDYGIQLIQWLKTEPTLEPAGRMALTSTLEAFSMQLQLLAQRIDGR